MERQSSDYSRTFLSSLILCTSFFILFFSSQSFAAQTSMAAKIIITRGLVEALMPPSNDWKPARSGMALPAGSMVRTGENGRASLLMTDETLIKLNRNTEFTITQVEERAGWNRLRGIIPASLSANGSKYGLKSGEAWLLNKNRDANIEIETTTVTAAIRGTELNIKMEPDATVMVSVLEGRVNVWNDFGDTTLTQGEEAITKPGSAPVKRLLLHPADAVQWTIVVPSLFTSGDLALVSHDKNYLQSERQRLETQVNSGGNTSEAETALGKVLRDLGELESARDYFEKALSGTDNQQALTGLGWCRLDQGQPGEALLSFGAVKQKTVESYSGHILALIGMEQFGKAAELSIQAKAAFPDSGELEAMSAWINVLSGNIILANQKLKELTAAKPDLASAWQLLALTSMVLDKQAQAQKAAKRAIALLPESPTPYILMSYIEQSRFDLAAAEVQIRQALALDSQNITALVDLARLQFGSGLISDAAQTINKAVSLAPESAEVNNLLGFIQLSMKKSDSMQVFAKAASQNDGMSEPHLGMGLVNMRAGDTAQALENITTAVLLDPRRSLLRSYWAKMLYQIGRHQKALDVLEIARGIDNRDPTPELYRSLIFKDLNKPTQAIAALRHAIDLNDNRAVYRSRFLLDQDLAVKNIDLANLFYDLGVTDWAMNTASDSIRQDYTNAAAHLFYAGSLYFEPAMSHARDTENLLARLLQTANVNTFNSFNEYTSFFELPSLDASLVAKGGTQDTSNLEMAVYGSRPSINLAYQIGYFFSETNGWRGSNYEDYSAFIGYFKWDVTLNDSFMFTALIPDVDRGDKSYPRFEFNDQASPSDHSNTLGKYFELGYRHTFVPGNDLLLYASLTDSTNGSRTHRQSSLTVLGFPADNLAITHSDTKQPYHTMQGEFIKKLGKHQAILGFSSYVGSDWYDSQTQNFTTVYFPAPIGATNATTFSSSTVKQKRRLRTIFVQDTWQAASSLTLEAALFSDRMHTGQSQLQTQWVVDEVNPRFGVTWKPYDQYTIQAAAFRYLLPFSTQGWLSPSNIAGVTIFRNDYPGTKVERADLVVKKEWEKGYAMVNPFCYETSYPVSISTNNHIEPGNRIVGVESRINFLPIEMFGISGLYRLKDITNRQTDANAAIFYPLESRYDHFARARINLVHPKGFSASLGQSFRFLNYKSELLEDQDTWMTDLEIAYEFPKKLGSITFEAKNIFNHKFDWVTEPTESTQGRNPAQELFLTLELNY